MYIFLVILVKGYGSIKQNSVKSFLCVFYGLVVHISMKCFVSNRELKFRVGMAVICREMDSLHLNW